MKRVFADTSYYLALINSSDAHHAAAVKFSLAGPMEFVTHPWVLVELANALVDPRNRQLFVDVYAQLRDDGRSIIVPANSSFLEHRIELFSNRPDKSWSLTDCISFVVMRENGLIEALTADHHFEQAGFQAMLRNA